MTTYILRTDGKPQCAFDTLADAAQAALEFGRHTTEHITIDQVTTAMTISQVWDSEAN